MHSFIIHRREEAIYEQYWVKPDVGNNTEKRTACKG
jgi:hypothetical protein